MYRKSEKERKRKRKRVARSAFVFEKRIACSSSPPENAIRDVRGLFPSVVSRDPTHAKGKKGRKSIDAREKGWVRRKGKDASRSCSRSRPSRSRSSSVNPAARAASSLRLFFLPYQSLPEWFGQKQWSANGKARRESTEEVVKIKSRRRKIEENLQPMRTRSWTTKAAAQTMRPLNRNKHRSSISTVRAFLVELSKLTSEVLRGILGLEDLSSDHVSRAVS